MTDDYEHPSAGRTSKRAVLQALVDRGATEGERVAAARQLAELDAKHREPVVAAPVDPLIVLVQQQTQDLLDELGSIHDAEVHAGKIGMFVVWRASPNAADWLQCFGRGSARLRLPDGVVMLATRCRGLIHDTEQDRWGVLYRAKDLRPA